MNEEEGFNIRLLATLASVALLVFTSSDAFAAATANQDVIGATLCTLVSNLSGGVARGIATLAIFAVGVGLFLGKVNWGIAATTAAGVGIIFGAPTLVGWLSGNSANGTCPTSGSITLPIC
jgi:type IV secretion system protein VirB2